MKDMLSVFSPAPLDWLDIVAELGYKSYRSHQIRTWIYEKFAVGFDEMNNIPTEMRDKLNKKFQFFSLNPEETRISAIDATKKYLWSIDLTNQNETSPPASIKIFFESVLIFSKSGRTTACVSSQTGCNVGCSYCNSSKIRPVRNIPGWAIVEQYWQMCRLNNLSKIDNVVFMGMGEPFHNYSNVIRAAERFTDNPGFSLQPKRITISTSGILPVMERYLKEKRPFGIAVSLNAPDTGRRAKIIPHAGKWDNSQLFDFAARFFQETNKKITFEYVLLSGFNDSPRDGRLLGKIFKKLPVKLNVIPFNPITSSSGNEKKENRIIMKAPSEQDLEAFIQAYLSEVTSSKDLFIPGNRDADYKRRSTGGKSPIMVRRSRGADIEGACGQLAAQRMLES